MLVLDNASDDGSADAVRAWIDGRRSLRRARAADRAERRTGKAENDTCCCARPAASYCLLLNEDSELRPGAVEALIEALDERPRAPRRRARSCSLPTGDELACAWRLPGLGTSLAQALFLHRPLVTAERRLRDEREVGWVQSSAMLVRRDAAERGRLPRPALLRLLRRDRLREAPARRRLARSSTSRRARPSTTSSWPPTASPGAAASSSSTAVATSTCESTTAARRRDRPGALRLELPPARARRARRSPATPPAGTGSTPADALRPNPGEGLREAAEAYNRRLTGLRPPSQEVTHRRVMPKRSTVGVADGRTFESRASGGAYSKAVGVALGLLERLRGRRPACELGPRRRPQRPPERCAARRGVN